MKTAIKGSILGKLCHFLAQEFQIQILSRKYSLVTFLSIKRPIGGIFHGVTFCDTIGALEARV